MNVNPNIPPADSPNELMLWSYLASQANNPVGLTLVIAAGTIYGLCKLAGLAARRPVEAYKETTAAPDPKQRTTLTGVYVGFLLVLLTAALLAYQGLYGLALDMFGIGFLIVVLLSERLTPKPSPPQPLPANLKLDDVIAWGQQRRNGSLPTPSYQAVQPTGVSSNGVSAH